MWGQQVTVENSRAPALISAMNMWPARIPTVTRFVCHRLSCREYQPLPLPKLQPSCGFCGGLACHQACLFHVRAELLRPIRSWSLSTMLNPVRANSQWHRPAPVAPAFGRGIVHADGKNRNDACSLSRRFAAFADLMPVAWTAILAVARCSNMCGQARFAAWRPPGRKETRPRRICRPSQRPASRVTTWSRGRRYSCRSRRLPKIIRKISADTNVALADPAIKDKLAPSGYVAGGSSPDGLGQSAQIGNRQMERRHQVGRHQNRLVFRATPTHFAVIAMHFSR